MASISASASPCGAVICLQNEEGQVPGACQMYRQPYFAIAVYNVDGSFNSQATAEARNLYLMTGCPTAPMENLMDIRDRYGEQQFDPGT